jgi:hypothetical protein
MAIMSFSIISLAEEVDYEKKINAHLLYRFNTNPDDYYYSVSISLKKDYNESELKEQAYEEIGYPHGNGLYRFTQEEIAEARKIAESQYTGDPIYREYHIRNRADQMLKQERRELFDSTYRRIRDEADSKVRAKAVSVLNIPEERIISNDYLTSIKVWLTKDEIYEYIKEDIVIAIGYHDLETILYDGEGNSLVTTRYDIPKKAAKGDVDNDNSVTSIDALNILHYSVGKAQFSDEQLDCADINVDTFVNSVDSVLALQESVA